MPISEIEYAIIVTSKPTKTAISLSKILDKPTKEIERFLDTFRAVPQARKNPPLTEPQSELFQFYKSWLSLLIDEIDLPGGKDSIALDCFIIYENLKTNDFTSLLLSLPPKDFNKLTKTIAAIAQK